MQKPVISPQVTATQHPLRMLASALVGRQVYISYLNNPSAQAWADRERVYIASAKPYECQRAELMVQSLLIAGDSLTGKVIPALMGRAELKKRYLLLEVERSAAALADRLPGWFLSSIIKSHLADLPATPLESLELARSSCALPAPPEWYGTIYPIRLLRQRDNHRSGNGFDQQALEQLESQLQRLKKELLDDDEDRVKDNFWQFLSSPKGKEGMMAKLLRELLDMSSSPEGQSGMDGAASSMEMVSAGWSKKLADIKNALRSNKQMEVPSAFLLQEPGVHSYPEWDCTSGKYRQDWVNVEEVEAWSNQEEESIGDFSGGDNSRYQKLLAGLCFNVERHRSQTFGDDLEVDRLVEMTTNVRAGFSGDERVYQANLKTRRDLGVQILVDVSSSTLEEAAAGRKICDVQMQAAWQLCRAFSTLGDRVAMHGFHSWGRALVRLQRLKNFNERVGGSVEQRCRRLSVAGYTRCGAAIRHGAQMLKQQSGMPFNLLLVISDGYPYDDQYEGMYAEEDTKKALEETRREGIACVCISVGSDVNSKKLKAIYGEANYLSVAEAEALPRHIRPVVEAAIAAISRKAR